MIIEPLNMYNYQILNNGVSIVGIVHSFAQGIVSSELISAQLKLDRTNTKKYIVRAAVVEV